MSPTKKIAINNITPEMIASAQQIARWAISFQSEPVDTKIGYAVLRAIFKLDPQKRVSLAGLRDGLHAGLNAGLHAGLHDGLHDGLHAGLHDGLRDGLHDGLDDGLNVGLRDGLSASLSDASKEQIKFLYCGVFWSWWLCRYLIAYCWGCKLDTTKLALLFAFCRFCPLLGYIESKDKTAQIVILPKPNKVRLVEVGLTAGEIPLPRFELHGDGEPSAEYHGLFNLYHWHNTKIPERMGKVKSSQWQPEWLLDETNAEIRRILMTEIGYERLARELHAEKIDSWREYSVVKFPQNLDVEPVQLLTMVCPSTGKLHALRVPPDIASAREAINWCNWGIDADQFRRET